MRSDLFVAKVGWGSYREFSGPFFRGTAAYVPPPTPSWGEKLLEVVTATEGGRYDAINMYDRCIVSVGLIQWCEAANVFGVSRVLASNIEDTYALIGDYVAELPIPKPSFRQAPSGQWRFFSNGTAIETKEQQRALFLGGSTGLANQWNAIQKGHARRVAAVFAAMMQEPALQAAQRTIASTRMLGFCMPESRRLLFAEGFPIDGLEGAVRAAFISFAANLPAVADQQLQRVAKTPAFSSADPRVRCLAILKGLTFGAGISIYPHRYNAIRPVLERLFGVDLPDFAQELQTAQDNSPAFFHYPDVRSIQRALLTLGYPLGPANADGVMGARTKAAILAFEQRHGLPDPDGVPDARFLGSLYEQHQRAIEKMEADGMSEVVPDIDTPESAQQ